MKKLLTIGLIAASVFVARADSWLSTNLNNTAVAVSTNYVLLSGAYNIKQIQITTANAATVKLYDNNTALTNYTYSEYVSVGTYTTNRAENVVTTTGVTNYMTNSYVWTYYITNAGGTGILNPLFAQYVPASTTTDPLPLSLVVSKGLTANITTTNVSVIVKYVPMF